MRSALVLALAVFASCSKPSSHRPTSGVDAGSFNQNALLTALGTCALGTYREIDAQAEKLVVATSNTATDVAAIKARRDAWNAAMDAWQQAEVMQVGPLAPTALGAGGEGLRNSFYSWPEVSRCEVDKVVATKGYEADGFAQKSLFNVHGLGALEYLLFYDGADNGCLSTDAINSTGTWAAIPREELATRRATYAKVLAADLRARTLVLIDKWDPAKGNFLGAFDTAGKGSKTFASVDDALNAANDALFYLEFVTKDRKLAAPTQPDELVCAEPPCGELLESRFAKRAKHHVKSNLIGFRKLFTGCAADFSGLGFDDLLDAIQASALADQMDGDLVAAIAAVDALPYATFEEALAADPKALDPIYAAVKKVTDQLKGEFLSVLKLKLPPRVAGDMD